MAHCACDTPFYLNCCCGGDHTTLHFVLLNCFWTVLNFFCIVEFVVEWHVAHGAHDNDLLFFFERHRADYITELPLYKFISISCALSFCLFKSCYLCYYYYYYYYFSLYFLFFFYDYLICKFRFASTLRRFIYKYLL